jgi:hypothetical protein
LPWKSFHLFFLLAHPKWELQTKKNTHKMPAGELYEISILFWNSCNNVTKIVYAKDEDSKLIDNYNITADSVIVVIKFLYCWWNSLRKKMI